MATITVRLPEEQKRLFMLIAEQQGVSASFMVDGMNNNSDPSKRPSIRKRLAEKLALIHSSGNQTRERIKE